MARLGEARRLIDGGGYFVVHAPRQTGKTTTLMALASILTAEGRYAALHFSCEAAEPVGDDFGAAERLVIAAMRWSAESRLPADCQPSEPPPAAPGDQLAATLTAWARRCARPLVLFFDEIDALRGESLGCVLRQLRSRFPSRPAEFPASVILCGLRDVSDHWVASGGDASRLGTSSPFNVKVDSLRLSNFDEGEVRLLYGQHTAETGQPFTDEALRRAFELTQGQPWLVNALAREVVEKIGVPPPVPITVDHIDAAKERLILARATHLDSLVARLEEPRVRGVIEPLISGELTVRLDAAYQDDVSYVHDLGLIRTRPNLDISNPIYREVIVRVLAVGVEQSVVVEPQRFVPPDGQLDLRGLLEAFAAFWKEHGEVLTGALPYHEVAPQLVLMAFLQRVVNGGGSIDREYGLGRKRIDLLVRWPYRTLEGRREVQREAIELKVWRPKAPDPRAQGLKQLDAYLDRLGLETGALVLFDRRPRAGSIAKRTRFETAASPAGRQVTVLRA